MAQAKTAPRRAESPDRRKGERAEGSVPAAARGAVALPGRCEVLSPWFRHGVAGYIDSLELVLEKCGCF